MSRRALPSLRSLGEASPAGLSALLAGAAALLAFVVLVWDVAGAWRATESRGRAVERIRTAAAAGGLDTKGWKARVRGKQETVLARGGRREDHSGSASPEKVPSALSMEVVLLSRHGDGRVEGTVDGSGRILALRLQGDALEATSRVSLDEASVEELAVGFLVALEILSARQAEELGDPVVEDRGMGSWRARWILGGDGTGGDGAATAAETLEVTLSGSGLSRLRRHRAVGDPPPFGDDRDDFDPFLALSVFLAGLLYFVQSRRFFHPHRNVLTLGVWAAALGGFGVVVTFQQKVFDGGAVGTFLAALFDPVLYRSFAALLFFGAGCAAARQAIPALAAPLETVLTGTWRRRRILQTVALGLALGPCLSLALGLVAGALRTDLQLVGGSPDAAAGRWPSLVALSPQVTLGAIAVFGMAAPWLRRIPWAPVARGLTVLAAGLLLVGDLPLQGDSPALFLAALVAGFLLEQVFHRWGLLAVLVTVYSSGAALRAVALAVQPGPLMISGGVALVALAAGCWVSARLARQAPEELLGREALALTPRHWAQRERIRAQLQVAWEAQARMLPASPPAIPGWSLAANCQPAREVGGDLYDFIAIGDRWAISQGDVSGKGMVASLFMTLTKGLLLAATEYLERPAEVLAAVNDGLYRETDRDIFVTLWYGLLDPEGGRLVHARAGHNSVLWRRSGRGETAALQPKGLAAGVVNSATFSRILEDEEVQLEPGDGLFIYTDGISEAMDGQRAEYGLERLESVIGRTDGMAAQEALDYVLADVRDFCGDAPVHDDLTLIVVRFEGSPAAG